MMKKHSVILVILLLVAPLHVWAQDCLNLPNIPKIPNYLGKGYDIVFGNPTDVTVDPGFKYDVIVFDYKDKVTTEDKNFLIPDGISYQKTQSCFLTSTVNEFKGTQSYQNNLKLSAKIGGGYDGEGAKASFTASAGFKSMQQKIEKQESVVYQASSRCQSYKLTLDVYKSYRVSSSFFQAVDLALKLNDWTGFFSQYGTHYATQVLFGGRAIQQSEYSRTSVAMLNEKGFDIGRSVKAGFAGLFAQFSQDLSISIQQKKEVEALRKKETHYFVGGVMPKDLSVSTWQTKVNEQPMPIQYKLMPLSDLFVFSPAKSPEWVNNAKQTFYKAINEYCVGKCSIPSPDKPVLKLDYKFSPYLSPYNGGDGGTFFQWYQFAPNWYINKVKIRSGTEIDGIQMFSIQRVKLYKSESNYYGGSGGQESSFTLEKDQWINKIQGRAGTRIDSLTFYTSAFRSWKFGGNGGTTFIVTPPTPEYRLIGIIGKSGARLDKIAFMFGLTQNVYKHQHHITKIVYPEMQKE